MVNQHIASYNHFVTVGLKRIMAANAVVRSDVRLALVAALRLAHGALPAV